jgi:AraC-like DNA-binding protein
VTAFASFDLDLVAPSDRMSAIGSAFAAMPQQLAVRFEQTGRVGGRFSRTELDRTRIERFELHGVSGVAERGATTGNDSAVEPSLTLHLLDAGVIAIRHGDRSARLGAGSTVLSDTAMSLTMQQVSRSAMTTVTIPRDRLALPESMIRTVLGRPTTAGTPAAGTIAATVRRIAADVARTPNAPWEVLEGTLVELLRALVLLGAGDDRAAGRPLGASLAERVLTYLEEHVLEPGLSAERIAAAHSISVRYLYVVLGQHDIALGDWIRTTRVRHAAGVLVDEPATPIAEIAHRCGFADHAHFARSFRAWSGMTPSAWRSEHRPG